MPQKPIIGVTPSHDTSNDDLTMRPTYMRAIAAAGGVPVILPLEPSPEDLKALVDMMDGFLFTGGPDVHPFLFGEDTQANCGNVSVPRDTMELALMKLVMETGKPILGICRGIQLLNIGLGGDIYQDIPSQHQSDFPLAHKQPFYYSIPSHAVTVEQGSLLEQVTKASSLKVNSMHHQAVRTPGKGIRPCAFSSDHLIEAIDYPGYPYFLAVQWHPEYLWEKDKAMAALFQSFIMAASGTC